MVNSLGVSFVVREDGRSDASISRRNGAVNGEASYLALVMLSDVKSKSLPAPFFNGPRRVG